MQGNAKVGPLAFIVNKANPLDRLSAAQLLHIFTVGGRGPDARSYRVSFAKIHELVPEFVCDWQPELGARQLLEVFSRVDLTHEDFLSRRFTRLKQIEYLRRTAQIDDSFFWNPLDAPADEAAVA